MKQARFKHEVVDSIPEKLQSNILYVTVDGDVAGHLCACGCGREVITPLSPTDWSITFDRRGTTLFPSIGNWAFPCRSHYFIQNGTAVWARDMSAKAIERGRHQDRVRKQRYYANPSELQSVPLAPAPEELPSQAAIPPLNGNRLLAWLKRLFAC